MHTLGNRLTLNFPYEDEPCKHCITTSVGLLLQTYVG